MVKLVGVIGGGDDKSGGGTETGGQSRVCLARRQFPLAIEPELTMIMALDDSCLACGAREDKSCKWTKQIKKDRDWEVFLRNYRR